MKKFLGFSIVVSLLTMGTFLTKVNAEASCPSNYDEVTLAMASSSSWRITCYELTRQSFGWSSITRHGIYDEDAGTLTVDGNTYRVKSNPAYGEKGTPGRYQYKAGPYYFNL